MNTTDTNNNANPAPVEVPAKIREEIADARNLAAVLSAPAVLAVLDRFNGKIVNARLWNALTDAAKEIDKGTRFYAPKDDARFGVVARLFRTRYIIGRDGNTYPAGYHEATIYAAPVSEREKTATGARLDAASVRADFERRADELTKTADQLEEQAAHFGEFVAELRELGERAQAIVQKWRPEFRDQLNGDGGNDVYRVAYLRNVTGAADFQAYR